MTKQSVRNATRSRWGALSLIVIAQFMVVLDISIVNVALPTIKSDLGFSEASLQWVISAYAIVFGGFLLLGGRLADLLGRRKVFMIGVALFSVASLLSALSWSAGALVGARALQGLGGALFAPAALALLMTTFREGKDRNLALGIWGAASGSGGAVGVLLGGVLTSFASWPWVFFINVPVGIALVIATPRVLAESKVLGGTRHFDVAGAFTVTSSLMLLVYTLTYADQHAWGSPVTFTLLVLSAALGTAFIWIESRAEAPLLPLRMFRSRTLAVANGLSIVVASLAFSEFFLLALYLQQVLHYSAMQTGGAFLAIAGTIAFVSNAAQTLVTRFGPRPVLASGLMLVSLSIGWFAQLPDDAHYGTDLLVPFILNGVGFALCFVPVVIAALTGVAPADAGIASGLVNTSRQLGGAVGLAAVTTVASSVSGLHGSPLGSVAATDALAHGFRTAFGVLAVLGLAGAGTAWAFLRPSAAGVEAVVEEELVPAEAA
jgi:EmrB/QacA subfamily drug resistance transporter